MCDFDKLLYASIIIGILIFFTAVLLIIIQGFNDNKFNNFSSVGTTTERVYYEQISYEIYSSIKAPIIFDFKIQENCEENYTPVYLNVKLNPTSNYLYNTNMTNLYHKKICIPIYKNFKDKYNISELKYSFLLSHSIKKSSLANTNIENDLNNICEEGFRPCGELDTLGNILCFPSKYGNCPLNGIEISKNNDTNLINEGYMEEKINEQASLYYITKETIQRSVIINIFLSIIKPWDHEWSRMIKLENNKKLLENITKYNEELEKRELFLEDYDNFMKEVKSNIPIRRSDIYEWEKNNQNFNKIKELNSKFDSMNDNFNIYFKNYIGFNSNNELENFKKYFNMSDYTDNPLYNMSKKIYPSTASIVLGFFVLIGLIVMFIVLLVSDYDDDEKFIILIPFLSLVFIYFITYTTLYFKRHKKWPLLEFKFDSQIQEVFNLYNKRRYQPVYLTGVIFFMILSPFPLIGIGVVIYFMTEGCFDELCEFWGLKFIH